MKGGGGREAGDAIKYICMKGGEIRSQERN